MWQRNCSETLMIMTEATMEIKTGSLFANRYKLLKRVEGGIHTQVWRVEDTKKGGHIHALKLFESEKELDPVIVQLLTNEFLSMTVKHPNLLMPTSFSVMGTMTYLLGPFVEHGSLRNVIRAAKTSRPLNEQRIVQLLGQMVAGLSFLHKNSFVHQDIAPENVLLGDGGVPLLSDFGISRILHNTLSHNVGPNRIFHIPYASPERFTARSANPADDVFSIGVLLYELAMGKLPWDGQGGKALLENAATPELDESFSEEFTSLVAWCLQKSPDHRPTSADIEKWAVSYHPVSVEEIRATKAEKKRKLAEAEEDRLKLHEAALVREEAQKRARDAADAKIKEAMDKKVHHKGTKQAKTLADYIPLMEDGGRKALEDNALLAKADDQKAREEAEQNMRLEAEQHAREEAERVLRTERDKLSKEMTARRQQEEAERRRREERDRKEREELDRKAREESEKRLREDFEKKLQHELDTRLHSELERIRKETESKLLETERVANERAGQRAREEVELRTRQEEERKAREEAERKAREEADRNAREEAERQAREEMERKAREEAERKAREEAERQAREEMERKAREEAERQAREEMERKAREEAERQAREEMERKAREEAERQAREEMERKAREEAERQAREEMERKAREEAERKAREEMERKAREEMERKVREEMERKAREEAERKAREEAERKAREEMERKARGAPSP
ncbi:MAG: protein kinase [Ignavibacteria bacterium]|nr:protein kinase [Ignavibacteria bacterium]